MYFLNETPRREVAKSDRADHAAASCPESRSISLASPRLGVSIYFQCLSGNKSF
jgi:hypothetical protein